MRLTDEGIVRAIHNATTRLTVSNGAELKEQALRCYHAIADAQRAKDAEWLKGRLSEADLKEFNEA